MSQEIEDASEQDQAQQEEQYGTVEQGHTETQSQQKQTSSQEINWQQANQALKFQQQKIDDLEKRLAAKEVVQEPDEFADLDPDDYMKVGKAKEMAEKIAKKQANETARRVVQEYAQTQSMQSDENRMRAKCDDYDYVIEHHAIPLIKNDPALAYRVQNSKNPAETAYKLGKLADSYQEDTTKQQSNQKADRILKNTSRPVSANAVGSPLKGQADQFSKMSNSQIWEQSQKYARQA